MCIVQWPVYSNENHPCSSSTAVACMNFATLWCFPQSYVISNVHYTLSDVPPSFSITSIRKRYDLMTCTLSYKGFVFVFICCWKLFLPLDVNRPTTLYIMYFSIYVTIYLSVSVSMYFIYSFTWLLIYSSIYLCHYNILSIHVLKPDFPLTL